MLFFFKQSFKENNFNHKNQFLITIKERKLKINKIKNFKFLNQEKQNHIDGKRCIFTLKMYDSTWINIGICVKILHHAIAFKLMKF